MFALIRRSDQEFQVGCMTVHVLFVCLYGRTSQPVLSIVIIDT